MTTYAEAERARQRAVTALRGAGLTAEAERLAVVLAALPPITDRESARVASDAAWDAGYAAAAAASAAYYAAGAAYAARNAAAAAVRAADDQEGADR